MTKPTAPKSERLEVRLDVALAIAFNKRLLEHGWEAAPVVRDLIQRFANGWIYVDPTEVGRQRRRVKPKPKRARLKTGA